MTLDERLRRFGEAGSVVTIFPIHLRPRLKKVNSAVLAVFVCAGGRARDVFRNGSLHGPDKWVNRTQNQDRRLFVPARVAQRFSAVFRGVRLERPGRIRPKLRRNAQRAEQRLRFHVARDDQ